MAYRSKGEHERALADFGKLIELDPDTGLGFGNRGIAYYNLAQYDRAIDDYTAALRFDPKDAASRYGRGMAKLKRGDTAGGNADLAEAKAMRPSIAAEQARNGVR